MARAQLYQNCSLQSTQTKMLLHLHKLAATAVMSAALALAITPAANAVPTLTVSDGTTTQTLTDASGAVVFNGPIGGFILNVVTGVTKPILGSASSPFMDLNFISVYSGAGPGTLTLTFSETSYEPLSGTFQSEIGGTLGSSQTLTYKTFFDAGNVISQTTTLLSSLGTFTTSPYSDTKGCVGVN